VTQTQYEKLFSMSSKNFITEVSLGRTVA